MPDRNADKWTGRAWNASKAPPIASAAIDMTLSHHPLKGITGILEALTAAESPDPGGEAEVLTIVPYRFGEEETQRLGGHLCGLAVWSDIETPDYALLLGVIVPDETSWYFVPTPAMPPSDRAAVIAATGSEG